MKRFLKWCFLKNSQGFAEISCSIGVNDDDDVPSSLLFTSFHKFKRQDMIQQGCVKVYFREDERGRENQVWHVLLLMLNKSTQQKKPWWSWWHIFGLMMKNLKDNHLFVVVCPFIPLTFLCGSVS